MTVPQLDRPARPAPRGGVRPGPASTELTPRSAARCVRFGPQGAARVAA